MLLWSSLRQGLGIDSLRPRSAADSASFHQEHGRQPGLCHEEERMAVSTIGTTVNGDASKLPVDDST
jgi:hypothetical protein